MANETSSQALRMWSTMDSVGSEFMESAAPDISEKHERALAAANLRPRLRLVWANAAA